MLDFVGAHDGVCILEAGTHTCICLHMKNLNINLGCHSSGSLYLVVSHQPDQVG